MKSSLRLILSLSAFAVTSTFASAETSPGFLEFGKIMPAKNGEFVEIDLDESLLGLAAQFAEGQEKEAAQILRGLKQVRVHVIGLDEENRSSVLERVSEVRAELAKEGWKRVAVVKDPKGADVAIFARTRGGNSIQGLAITVVDEGKQAVIVNIVGEIKPEQITALGNRFNIEPLKKIKFAKN